MQTIETTELQISEEKPKPAGKQICDGCGGTVPASYEAVKGNYTLNFCGHHIRKYAEQLSADGFAISPEDISYDASHVSE